MFEKLSDNLNILMAKARINASELARQTGIPASTIKKIRNNDNPNPTLTTLIPLAHYFSVTLTQLIGDEVFSDFQLKRLDPKNSPIQQIPLLSWKDAANWPNNSIKTNHAILIENKYDQNTYGLFVEESDWEGFPKDTILIIDPSIIVEHRDFAILLKEGQEIPSLKQVLYDEGQPYLKPVIQGYQVVPFTPQHKCLGVVMEHRKQIKKSQLIRDK